LELRKKGVAWATRTLTATGTREEEGRRSDERKIGQSGIGQAQIEWMRQVTGGFATFTRGFATSQSPAKEYFLYKKHSRTWE